MPNVLGPYKNLSSMITNRFQITEIGENGSKAVLPGMVFKFYDGATKAAGRLARVHPNKGYIILDKQTKLEYIIKQIEL